VKALARNLEQAYGRIDVLVNNAGIFPEGSDPAIAKNPSVLTVPPEMVLQAFEANTLGPYRLCQALVPLLKDGGRIVNVSSGMGELTDMQGQYPAYRMSKTALNALTRILSQELAGRGIKVNSVCPGWVRTEMGGANATRGIPEGIQGIVWAATLPDDGPSGGFFRDGKPLPW
jgi:NAD(P)-dependent dehydrogenase (short-subunit alcohol dehydrogenase family)